MSKRDFSVGLASAASGAVAAAVAIMQYFSPSQIETPEDLLSALDGIRQAVDSESLRFSGDETETLKRALGEFNAQIALAARSADGTLPFVPQSYLGVNDYASQSPTDFTAPNGTRRTLTVEKPNSAAVRLRVDGDVVARMMRPGDRVAVPFGDQQCTFEMISTERSQASRIRSFCE